MDSLTPVNIFPSVGTVQLTKDHGAVSHYLKVLGQRDWIERWALNVCSEVLRQPSFLDNDVEGIIEYEWENCTFDRIYRWLDEVEVDLQDPGCMDALPSAAISNLEDVEGPQDSAKRRNFSTRLDTIGDPVTRGCPDHPKRSRTWISAAHGHRPLFTYDDSCSGAHHHDRFCAPASAPSTELSSVKEALHPDESWSQRFLSTCEYGCCHSGRIGVKAGRHRSERLAKSHIRAYAARRLTETEATLKRMGGKTCRANHERLLNSVAFPEMYPLPPYNEEFDYGVFYNTVPHTGKAQTPQQRRNVYYTTMPAQPAADDTDDDYAGWWWNPQMQNWILFTDDFYQYLSSGWYYNPVAMWWSYFDVVHFEENYRSPPRALRERKRGLDPSRVLAELYTGEAY